MKKRILSGLLAIMLVVLSAPIPAHAENTDSSLYGQYQETKLEVFGEYGTEDWTDKKDAAMSAAFESTGISAETAWEAATEGQRGQMAEALKEGWQDSFGDYVIKELAEGVDPYSELTEDQQILATRPWSDIKSSGMTAENWQIFYEIISSYYYVDIYSGWDCYYAGLDNELREGEGSAGKAYLCLEYNGKYAEDPDFLPVPTGANQWGGSTESIKGGIVFSVDFYLLDSEEELADKPDGTYWLLKSEKQSVVDGINELLGEGWQYIGSASEAKAYRAKVMNGFLSLIRMIHVKGADASTGMIADTGKRAVVLPEGVLCTNENGKYVGTPIQSPETLDEGTKAVVKAAAEDMGVNESEYELSYCAAALTDAEGVKCTSPEVVDIILPYPSGMSKESFSGYASSAFHWNGESLEWVEISELTNDGIVVKATSCSPFLIAYQEPQISYNDMITDVYWINSEKTLSEDEEILAKKVMTLLVHELQQITGEEEKAAFLTYDNIKSRYMEYMFDSNGILEKEKAQMLREIEILNLQGLAISQKVDQDNELLGDGSAVQEAYEAFCSVVQNAEVLEDVVEQKQIVEQALADFQIVVKEKMGVTDAYFADLGQADVDISGLREDEYFRFEVGQQNNYGTISYSEYEGQKSARCFLPGQTDPLAELYLTDEYYESIVPAFFEKMVTEITKPDGEHSDIDLCEICLYSSEVKIPLSGELVAKMAELESRQGVKFKVNTNRFDYENITGVLDEDQNNLGTVLGYSINPYLYNIHWDFYGGGYDVSTYDAFTTQSELGDLYFMVQKADGSGCERRDFTAEDWGYGEVRFDHVRIESAGLHIVVEEKGQVSKVKMQAVDTTNAGPDEESGKIMSEISPLVEATAGTLELEFVGDAKVEIGQEAFASLQNAERADKLTLIHDNITYSFDASNISDTTRSMTLGSEERTASDYETYRSEDQGELQYAIDFAHSGALPGKASVTLSVDGLANGSYTWSYANPATQKLEEGVTVEVRDGSVIVPLEHCSTYVLTAGGAPASVTPSPAPSSPTGSAGQSSSGSSRTTATVTSVNTGDMAHPAFWSAVLVLAVLGMAGCGVYFWKKKEVKR